MKTCGETKCIHSFCICIIVTILYLLCVPLAVHLHNCCSSDIQIFWGKGPITWMIALNDSIVRKLSQGHCYVFLVGTASFFRGSICNGYTFVFQHSMQLIPKAKESLIGFSCSVLCFYEICVIGSVLLLLLPLTKKSR